MTDEIFDPLPGDDYPDGPVDAEGKQRCTHSVLEPDPVDSDPTRHRCGVCGEAFSVGVQFDVGPPAPGEGDDLLDRDELEMEC